LGGSRNQRGGGNNRETSLGGTQTKENALRLDNVGKVKNQRLRTSRTLKGVEIEKKNAGGENWGDSAPQGLLREKGGSRTRTLVGFEEA